MALVSDIEIRLRADIARLSQDLERARQQVSSSMTRITDMVKKAGAAFVGLAAGLSVAALGGWIRSAIDATDAASDLAQRTGIAVEELAGLQLWFQIGGAEAGAFEASMTKLAKTIADGGAGFDSIGVATRNANGSLRSTVDVLLDSGDAFAKMEDGTQKTAKAIELFGKSGAVLIPILNSGSEGLREMTEMADKLGLTFDQKTVDAAGNFNDSLDFLGLAAQGVGRKVAAELLPTLNSLISSLLEFVTSGNGVQTAANTIAAGFKIIYTVGVSVVTLFTTLGKVIAGSMALVTTNVVSMFDNISRVIRGSLSAISAGASGAMNVLKNLASGDIQGAWNAIGASGTKVGNELNSTFSDVWSNMQMNAVKSQAIVSSSFEDISEGLKSGGKAISDVWTGQKNLAIEAFSTVTSNSAATADAVVKDAKKMAEAQKLVDDILKKSNDDWDALNQQLADNMRDLAKDRQSMIESAQQEAEQNEFLVETYGMSEAAIIRLTASRLLDQEAQKLGRTLNEEEIADLQRVIDLKERSAKAVANRAELEATKAFWTDIEKTAHDTFVSIADGGKNAFQRLKETAKNTFFDWLYQMTIKKWIINIGTSVAGTAGVSGIAGAATGTAAASAGGGIGSALSAAAGLGSLTSGVGLLGAGGLGLQAGFGALMSSGLAGVSAAVSGGIAAIGAGTGASIAAGMGTIAGALGPIALGIGGAVMLLNKAFGRGSKELTGNSKLTGSLTAAEFAGSFQDEWKKKGGWFSSSKTGFDSRAVDTVVAQGLGATYQAITSTSADYARMLGINADSIATRTQSISIAMGKDEAANQKAIADFFTGVANTVAGELLPEISKFQMAGEEASATLQRLATNYVGLDQVLTIMGSTSQKAFGAVGVASIEARERLIAFAGGLEALASQTTFFNQNFLSQAEQVAIVQKPLNEALTNLGYAGITTADQFKAAVLGLSESGALATAEGAKTYAGLLALAPAFKTVSDYLKEVSDAAAETAKDLEQVALAERERAEAAIQAAKEAALAQLEANEQILRGLVDTALGAVQRAVEAQKNIVTKAYQDSMTALQARISSVGESISKITELSTLLKNSLGTVSSDAQQGASRAAARAQVTTALAIAKASGVLPSADSLRDALSTLNQDATEQFSSLVDYQREVARTNANITALGGLTDKQLTEAQMQLKLLEDTKALAEKQYADEISRLDGIIEWAQAEVDAINGVNNSVMGVWAAMNGLNVALADLKTGATPGNPGGSTLTVEQLYRDVLGREGEAAGIAFWRNAFGSVVDSGEYAEFLKGAQPELDMIDRQKRQMESAALLPGSGTMSSSSVSPEQAAFNQRMETMQSESTAAIKRMSDQFHQVSGGGNSLLIENT